jgi:hypothetical protein
MPITLVRTFSAQASRMDWDTGARIDRADAGNGAIMGSDI